MCNCEHWKVNSAKYQFCSSECLLYLQKIIEIENESIKRLKLVGDPLVWNSILLIRLLVRRYLESKNQFVNDDGLIIGNIWNLLSNTEKLKQLEPTRYVTIVKLCERVKQSLESHLQLSMDELIELINIIEFNTFAIYTTLKEKKHENESSEHEQLDSSVKLEKQYHGYGLFPAASFFNHSCNPVCTYSFEGRPLELVIRTEREIAVEEELTISYGEPGTVQQCVADVQEFYLFQCGCSQQSLAPTKQQEPGQLSSEIV